VVFLVFEPSLVFITRSCKEKKHLKEMGLGNRPNAAEALEPEDEEELYNCGAFGTENPDSLLSISVKLYPCAVEFS
jgi:hypothetical protein